MAQAKIKVPAVAQRGEIIEIRVLIRHPMEPGFRRDNTGKTIAKNVINQLVCRYNGNEVFRAEFSSGIAANPYLSFFTIAEDSGDIEVSWIDDEGVSGSVSSPLTVNP